MVAFIRLPVSSISFCIRDVSAGASPGWVELCLFAPFGGPLPPGACWEGVWGIRCRDPLYTFSPPHPHTCRFQSQKSFASHNLEIIVSWLLVFLLRSQCHSDSLWFMWPFFSFLLAAFQISYLFLALWISQWCALFSVPGARWAFLIRKLMSFTFGKLLYYFMDLFHFLFSALSFIIWIFDLLDGSPNSLTHLVPFPIWFWQISQTLCSKPPVNSFCYQNVPPLLYLLVGMFPLSCWRYSVYFGCTSYSTLMVLLSSFSLHMGLGVCYSHPELFLLSSDDHLFLLKAEAPEIR